MLRPMEWMRNAEGGKKRWRNQTSGTERKDTEALNANSVGLSKDEQKGGSRREELRSPFCWVESREGELRGEGSETGKAHTSEEEERIDRSIGESAQRHRTLVR